VKNRAPPFRSRRYPEPLQMVRLIAGSWTDKKIYASSEAQQLLKQLNGRSIRLRLKEHPATGLTVKFTCQGLYFASDEGEPDAIITMSALDWMKLTAPSHAVLTNASEIIVEGNDAVAEKAQALLDFFRPQWGEMFGRSTISSFAYLGRLKIRNHLRGYTDLPDDALRDFGDALIHESGFLAERRQVLYWFDEVDQIREAVDRLQARMNFALSNSVDRS